MADKVFCPDCEAEMQLTHEGWRCPWATRDHRREDGVVIACGRPFERSRELVIPTQTRTR